MKNTIKSLALLKTTIDQHPEIKDYLDIFMPFLITLLKKRKLKDLRNIEILCEQFFDEFGLRIPHHPMVTMVNKLLANGFGIEVSPENFQPIQEKLDECNFEWDSQELEIKFTKLIEIFIHFAKNKHSISLSEDEASRILLLLVDDHDLDIMFIENEDKSILPTSTKSPMGKNLAYDFVRMLFESKSEFFDVISNVAFGHVVASLLLFDFEKSPATETQRVNYYLDTGILFGLFGINGDYEKKVYDEFLRLLSANNGRIFIFNHTYNEFINIVAACKDWIDSASYDPNKANRALISFKTQDYHRSDIDILLTRIPRILTIYGISRIDIPDPNIDIDFQISDIEFQKKLIDQYKRNNPHFDEEEKEGTIYLDVKSVSAIHKLRRGVIPRKLNDSGHVLITRNSTLAYASRVFESQIDKIESFYIPSTITDVFVGTVIWLNSPMKFDLQKISQSRLIANCYAALHPSKQLKALFLIEVSKAEKDGLLSPEDISVLRSSKLAEELLQEQTLGNPKKINVKTPIEIMIEIRSKAKYEAANEYKQKEMQYQEMIRNTEKEINGLLIEKKMTDEENSDKERKIIEEKEKNARIINALKDEVVRKSKKRGWFAFSIFILILLFVNIKDLITSLFPIPLVWKIVISIVSASISISIAIFQLNAFKIKEKVVKKWVDKEMSKYGISDLD